MTVAEALRRGEERLRAAGVPDPALDAELLLRHALRWDRAAVIAHGEERLSEADEKRLFALVEERAARRPLQHLTGTQAFWRHEFLVTPDVLIPRPETEVLVETALELIRGRPAPVVVDVGTGSGSIALSIAAERPDALVHAVDVSPAALAVARENARRLDLASRVCFHLGDLLEPWTALQASADLVASNPPYVDAADLAGLEPEVRVHEPTSALVPEGDPYSVYRRLFPQSRRLLRPGGRVAVEVGRGMVDGVARLAGAAGLRLERIVPDLASIPRVVVARRA